MQEIKSQPAVLLGQAQRIPAAVKAQPAVLRATIQITRAATGQVEEYTIVGTPISEKEPNHGSHP
jgi:hypothetical protein